MTIQQDSDTTPSASWYVLHAQEQVVGPLTDFQLREGLLVYQWGGDARVAVSSSGPWKPANEVRKQYLYLIQHGWYVQSSEDGQRG
jgi:hypothetical protein